MYFLIIKIFKHLHEKVLERDMHARMQNSYARRKKVEVRVNSLHTQTFRNTQFSQDFESQKWTRAAALGPLPGWTRDVAILKRK